MPANSLQKKREIRESVNSKVLGDTLLKLLNRMMISLSEGSCSLPCLIDFEVKTLPDLNFFLLHYVMNHNPKGKPNNKISKPPPQQKKDNQKQTETLKPKTSQNQSKRRPKTSKNQQNAPLHPKTPLFTTRRSARLRSARPPSTALLGVGGGDAEAEVVDHVADALLELLELKRKNTKEWSAKSPVVFYLFILFMFFSLCEYVYFWLLDRKVCKNFFLLGTV